MSLPDAIRTNVRYIRTIVRSQNPPIAGLIEPYLAKIDDFAGRLDAAEEGTAVAAATAPRPQAVQRRRDGIVDQAGEFHPYGDWATLPAGQTAESWLAGPSGDTVEYLRQQVYLFANPDAPVSPDFPSEATDPDPWIRLFAIEQAIYGLATAPGGPYGVDSLYDGLYAYALSYTAQNVARNGQSVTIPPEMWALVPGGETWATSRYNPGTLPPDVAGAA